MSLQCYPPTATVKGRVLAELLAGRAITGAYIWRHHGSSRCAHHVYILRGLGLDVATTLVAAPTSDGRKSHIAEYRLPASAIRQAAEAGRRFVVSCLGAGNG